MTWHMAPTLRAGCITIAVLLAATGIFVIIVDVYPAQPGYIALGIAVIGAATNLAKTGWRAALTVAGDVLTVHSALRAKQVQRAEITAVGVNSAGFAAS